MPGPRPKYTIALHETPAAALRAVSRSYTAPVAQVQRARVLLLAHPHPDWTNGHIAQAVGCCVDTVKVGRQRWHTAPPLDHQPRRGAPREVPALVRTQVVALACTKPTDQGKVWRRWSGEQLAAVAIAQGIVPAIAASTSRRWLREDKINSWRYHAWQKSTNPQLVATATPVLALYEQAPARAPQAEEICCVDEKTSIQVRHRVRATNAAVPDAPGQVADRSRRMGALHLCCALLVATGTTVAPCFRKKGFADFKTFLLTLFSSTGCQGLKVLHLILDKGSTQAPQQRANWIATLNLSFEVRIYWLPTHASWLDQVEIVFRKVQRDV